MYKCFENTQFTGDSRQSCRLKRRCKSFLIAFQWRKWRGIGVQDGPGERNPRFPDRGSQPPSRSPPFPYNGRPLAIGHCNVATNYLTDSRRRNAICSGRITVFLRIITSAEKGGEAKLVQPGMQRAPLEKGSGRGSRQQPTSPSDGTGKGPRVGSAPLDPLVIWEGGRTGTVCLVATPPCTGRWLPSPVVLTGSAPQTGRVMGCRLHVSSLSVR
jgi:hypothetical protein